MKNALKTLFIFLIFGLFTIPQMKPAYCESMVFTVDPGVQEVIPLIELEANMIIQGSIKVSGGGNEVKFWIIDPDGNTILHLGTIVIDSSFEFTASKTGLYSIKLDNRESMAAKNIRINYDVAEEPKPKLYIWGLVLLAIVLVIYFNRKWKES